MWPSESRITNTRSQITCALGFTNLEPLIHAHTACACGCDFWFVKDTVNNQGHVIFLYLILCSFYIPGILTLLLIPRSLRNALHSHAYLYCSTVCTLVRHLLGSNLSQATPAWENLELFNHTGSASSVFCPYIRENPWMNLTSILLVLTFVVYGQEADLLAVSFRVRIWGWENCGLTFESGACVTHFTLWVFCAHNI
jgi:hypothetical protein